MPGPTPFFLLTDHALRRYRERFDPRATRAAVVAMLKAAAVEDGPHGPSAVVGRARFVLAPDLRGTSGFFAVLTCIPIWWDQLPRRAKRCAT